MSDIFSYLVTDLNNNINDPLATSRPANERFVLTAYPKRAVSYPVITLRMPQIQAYRAGMQTNAIDTYITVEIRIWARNTKERDTIYQDVVNRLKDIQYIANTGSQDSGLHNFKILNTQEVNEDGDNTPKSRIINVSYAYYNPN